MSRVARLVGCTEGQAYTLVLGLCLAVALLLGTLPAARRAGPSTTAGGAAAASGRSPAEVTPFGPDAASTAAAEADAPATLSPTAPAGSGEATFPAPSTNARPAVSGGGRDASPAADETPATTPRGPQQADDPASAPGAVTVEPLRILEGGWATTGAGTPAARTGVPPDTFPVAATASGETARRSFVRLSGTATALVLRVRTDPSVTFNETGAAVRACAITDPSWEPREAVPLESAPAFDGGACAPGARRADGSWRFDLGAFDARDTREGFTVLPDPVRSSGPFQLVFEPSTGDPS